jgi:oligopeptidase A
MALNQLPHFAQVKPEHMEEAIDTILTDNRAAIANLVSHPLNNWVDIDFLEELDNRLGRVWAVIRHLNAVADSDELRSVYSACQDKISEYGTQMGQNEGLYGIYKAVKEQHYSRLSPTQQKIVDNALLSFELSGISLEGEARKRFAEIQQSLSKLERQFGENVLDATQAFGLHLGSEASKPPTWYDSFAKRWLPFAPFYSPSDKGKLAGLPESALSLLAQNAKQVNKEGYFLTLDAPSFMAIVTYAKDSNLRKALYEAYQTRASDQGPNAGQFDNTPVMVEILNLKQEMAKLLGYESYSHLSLVKKMAETPEEVLSFLEDLAKRAKPLALKDKEDLTAWARENFPGEVGKEGLNPWDIAYYSTKLQEARYSVSDEALRPYFPAHKVFDGLFAVAKRVWGIDITECTGVEVWHPKVKYFEIHDREGNFRGSFYLDISARKGKRGGAWMDECVCRMVTRDGLQYPIAYLTCNFTPAVGDEPALLTHDEVVTLFHEFGHGIHHMLTQVIYPSVGGINGVPWDAVELPSQLMEFWCWEEEALDIISGHYQTGKPLDKTLLKNLLAARNFQSALQTVRQLEFALFDFRLHLMSDTITGATIQKVLDDTRKEVAAIIPPAFSRFQNGFSHIFAGGYSAGYFSYKWAELLAADAFSKFAENGIFNEETGKEFMSNILEQGGSRNLMDLYVSFRGRKPTIDALLHYSGLSE